MEFLRIQCDQFVVVVWALIAIGCCRCLKNTYNNGIGIMAKRFRVFHAPIGLEPSKVKKIVMAACVLHNMFREEVGFSSNLCCQGDPATHTVTNGSWREDPILDNDLVCGCRSYYCLTMMYNMTWKETWHGQDLVVMCVQARTQDFLKGGSKWKGK